MCRETKYVHPNGTQGSHHWKKFNFFLLFITILYVLFQLLATICLFIESFCHNFIRIVAKQWCSSSCDIIAAYYITIIDVTTKFWNLTEKRNWRYEIWPKNALLASKHDVPLGCTSLVVSNHFSEFLYGIYRRALTLI